MKKILFIILSSLLLMSGCSEAEIGSGTDFDLLQDYQSKAHDALNSYSDDIEESSDSDFSIESSVALESSEDDLSYESITENESSFDVESETSEKPVDAITPEILLVTADIAYEDGTAATLVCGRDGSIDLYFANGYELRYMGDKGDCREMSNRLLNTCYNNFSSFKKVTELPFPESGITFIYLKTSNGFYKLEYDNTEILLGVEGDIEICVKNAITNITKYAAE